MSLNVPHPDLWDPEDLCCADMEHTPEEAPTAEQPPSTPLQQLLEQCTQSAYAVSDDISAVYFTHSGEAKQSLGI